MLSFARSSPALYSCNFPAFRSVGVQVSGIGKDIGREPTVHPPQALVLDFGEQFGCRQHSVNIAASYTEIIYPFGRTGQSCDFCDRIFEKLCCCAGCFKFLALEVVPSAEIEQDSDYPFPCVKRLQYFTQFPRERFPVRCPVEFGNFFPVLSDSVPGVNTRKSERCVSPTNQAASFFLSLGDNGRATAGNNPIPKPQRLAKRDYWELRHR